MPRVIKRTPEWLIPPSQGHSLFTFKHTKSPGANQASYDGSTRTIANGRGSEVFVATGNELRWANLGALKQGHEETSMNRTSRTSHSDSASQEGTYRSLKIPGAGSITQLVISPEKEFMAIVRSHQIYIAVLPDTRHLTETHLGPYKLRCFHLGPTIHCIEEAPVVSALWHPLGEYGRCLVTLSQDAVVRLWELNKDDRSTFEQPATSIDLKRLANAVSADQDFSATKFGSAKGFTPDSVELEPASICFGGKSLEGENPWHAMTLWLATKEGDVYAICPLLPRRFEAAADFLDSLSSLVAAKQLEAKEDRTKLLSSEAQAQFLDSLQNQEPILAQGATELDARYIYSRPAHPGPAPKLQGPLELDPDLDEEQDLADIYVTPFSLPRQRTFDDDDEDEDELPESASLVCLLTTLSQVLITIDFDGVDGHWIPGRSVTPYSTPKNRSVVLHEDHHTLTLFEVISLNWTDAAMTAGPPSITPDIASPHAFFVTDASGVHYISAVSWLQNIQNELSDVEHEDTGSNIRFEAIIDGAKSLVEHIISFPPLTTQRESTTPVRSVVFADGHSSGSHSSLGYFILTSRAGEPWAAELDISDADLSALNNSYPTMDDADTIFSSDAQRRFLFAEPRDVYRPDPKFDGRPEFPSFVARLDSDRKTKLLLKEDLDMESGDVLQIFIDSHKVVSRDHKEINFAASALFAQCEKLRDGLKDQINRVRELKEMVERLNGDDDEEDEDDDEKEDDDEDLRNKRERRIEIVRSKQEQITERLEKIKSKAGRISTRALSDKERSFGQEVDGLDRQLVTGEVDKNGPKASELMNRFTTVTLLLNELKEQAEKAEKDEKASGKGARNGLVSVPDGVRKKRVQGILELLEREQVLVDRASQKLESLKL